MKKCILEDKLCTNCGQCDDRCELDPTKICDNCFRCLEIDDRAYIEIPISGVYTGEDYVPDDPRMDVAPRPHIHAQTLPGLAGERRRRGE